MTLRRVALPNGAVALMLTDCEPSGHSARVATPTADELRKEMGDPRKKLDVTGVDFDKLAAAIVTARVPPGWSPPVILPPIWRLVEQSESDDGAKYSCDSLKILAILSCAVELDGRAWLHLSVSHKARLPSWREMGEAKRVFLGDREAYQVIPPKARYVNINERVLHMFALLDGSAALPDFTAGTGSL